MLLLDKTRIVEEIREYGDGEGDRQWINKENAKQGARAKGCRRHKGARWARGKAIHKSEQKSAH
jgi:hypothetical protein